MVQEYLAGDKTLLINFYLKTNAKLDTNIETLNKFSFL